MDSILNLGSPPGGYLTPVFSDWEYEIIKLIDLSYDLQYLSIEAKERYYRFKIECPDSIDLSVPKKFKVNSKGKLYWLSPIKRIKEIINNHSFCIRNNERVIYDEKEPSPVIIDFTSFEKEQKLDEELKILSGKCHRDLIADDLGKTNQTIIQIAEGISSAQDTFSKIADEEKDAITSLFAPQKKDHLSKLACEEKQIFSKLEGHFEIVKCNTDVNLLGLNVYSLNKNTYSSYEQNDSLHSSSMH